MRTVNFNRTKQLLITSILISIGIILPMIMPVKVIIGPASYTLASHVPIFIAMMISPFTAISVALGTTLGFLLSGFPIVIVFRAFSHLLFVLCAVYLFKWPSLSKQSLSSQIPWLIIVNLLHALGEVMTVLLFSITEQTTQTTNFFYTLWVLIGLGTFIHGMIDYVIAHLFIKRIKLPLK